jgi:hypothetical protein
MAEEDIKGTSLPKYQQMLQPIFANDQVIQHLIQKINHRKLHMN